MREPSLRVNTPAVELLDSRTLLSTTPLNGLNRGADSFMAAANAHHKVVLVGQIVEQAPGQFKITPASDGAEFATPISAQVQGTGDLGLGTPVSINASMSVKKPIKNLVLMTDQGNIDIHTNIDMNGFSTQHYTIVGGSGAYAHATGSGTIQEDFESEPPDLEMALAFNRRIDYTKY